MDWTFLVAALIGASVWALAYLYPGAAALRDSLGKGELGNRLLLVLIPGLTTMCLGVALGEALFTYAPSGASAWKTVGLPVAALLAVSGLFIALYAMVPVEVPQFLRPAWLRAEDRGGLARSLQRVRRAQERRAARAGRRGWEELEPRSIGQVALGLPPNWIIDTAPADPQGRAGVDLHSLFVADTPSDFSPAARFMMWRSQPLDPAQIPPATRALALPAGWEVLQVESTTVAQAPTLHAVSCRYASSSGAGAAASGSGGADPAGLAGGGAAGGGAAKVVVGMQSRWVMSWRGCLWVAVLQVRGQGLEAMADFERAVLQTLVLPSA